MSKEQNHIDNLFQNAFDGFESKPSSNVWKGIVNDTFDQNIQDSFTDFSEVPSPMVWAAIHAEFDFDTNVQESFGEFEVNPPPRMWKAITSQMAFDESLNHAFNEYEVEPHPEVWENITSEAIDSRFKSVFSKFESEPAEENWEKIRRAVPVNLFLRNTLNSLSKIAAILVVGLFLAFIVNYSGQIAPTASPEVASGDVTNPLENKLPKTTPNSNNTQTSLNTTVAGIEEEVDEIVSNTIEETPNTPASIYNNSTLKNNTASVSGNIFAAASIPNSTVYNKQTLITNTKSGFPPLTNVVAAVKNPSTKTSVANTEIEKVKILDKLPSKIEVQLASNNEQLINVNQLVSYDINSVKSNQNPTNYLLTSLAGAGSDVDAEMVKVKNSLVSRTDSKRALKMLSYKGIYVLVSGQYSNTWVLNDDVKSKLSGLVQADYIMDFGGSVGAGLGIQISPRFGLEAQWNYSRLNQRYRELIPEGFYINSETNLTYSSFPVLARVQITRVKNNRPNPMTSSLVLGMQYRYLRNAVVKSEIELPDANELFLSQELGIVLGWDYSMHLNPNTFLTVGARAAVGSDIHKLSSLSSESNYNAEFGVRMALNYKVTR